MYNIQYTTSQKFTISSTTSHLKSTSNTSSLKILSTLSTDNNFKILNKTNKILKIYPTQALSYKNYLTTFETISENNLIKCYIKITLNNIFVTYNFNNKIKTISLAALGFKGKSKQTTYAFKTFAETLANEFCHLAMDNNSPIILNIYACSLNYKLKTFLKIFKLNNLKINKIYDVTPIPYNGCRKKKISIKKKKKSIIKFLSYR